jgi:hypothetical protein
LRPGDKRCERQRGSGRGQMQKLPTVGTFHASSSAPGAWSCAGV